MRKSSSMKPILLTSSLSFNSVIPFEVYFDFKKDMESHVIFHTGTLVLDTAEIAFLADTFQQQQIRGKNHKKMIPIIVKICHEK